MVCFVEEEKYTKYFNEILEKLENEEMKEMLSEEIYNNVSVHSLFIYFYLSLFFFAEYKHQQQSL